MKKELFSAIGIAIAGVLIGFFVMNISIPELSDFSFQAINDAANSTAAANGYNYASLVDPDAEVFNFDSLNPTVEVYVGECAEYDENGNCVEETTEEDNCAEYNADGECVRYYETEENEEPSNQEADDQENN